MKKSSFPYLVDISVGDSCPFGCPFCYTSSTTSGKYADSYFLTSLSSLLIDCNVFNVVFGGGEPTLYSKDYCGFYNILKTYSSEFVVGVTTKNYKYHLKPTFSKEIECIDSLAISCQTIDDLIEAKKLQENVPPTCVVYIQTILGASSWKDFQDFVNKLTELRLYRLTILGYKNYGFGKNSASYDIPDEWINFVKNTNLNIGIDSILCEKYKDKLISAGVPYYTLTGKEGLSSCYIDAAKKVMKPSSFCDIEYPIDPTSYKFKSDDFLKIFSQF